MRLENTPGEKSAHIERTHPSFFEDVIRKIKAKLGPRKALGLSNEVSLVLKGRHLLQHRNNAIKAPLDLLLISLEKIVLREISERVSPKDSSL